MENLLATDSEIFLAARASLSRSAVTQGQTRDLTVLFAPQLFNLAAGALGQALGRAIEDSTPFPSMIWYGGAKDTYRGHKFLGTFKDFIEHVLVARSREIAAKRCGWVVTPTTCSDGHRANASTLAMHALNLDCDSTGGWERLLGMLDRYGFAYAAYQSGGWSETAQKWHVLIPLDRPFDTSTPDKIELWKSTYHHARVVFGALGQLRGEGFDPACETPCQPVFITERRSPDAPERKIVWKTGRALDLVSLMVALPPIPDSEQGRRLPGDDPSESELVDRNPLSDEKLEKIVSAICVPMSKIMSGRRDLYLCLPGALLDRGLHVDDVLSAVEEISLRCPGDPGYTQKERDDRHREHVHCARTTIAKYESGGAYTRIGTLAQNWPDVADALDEVLPDPEIDALKAMLAGLQVKSSALVVAAPVTHLPSIAEERPRLPGEVAPLDLADLRKRLVRLKSRKIKSQSLDEKIRGVVLAALLDGEDLLPRMPDGTVVNSPKGEPYTVDEAVGIAMRMIAFKLPAGTPFEAVVEIARPSLRSCGGKYEHVLKKAERAFLKAVGKKVENEKVKYEADVQQRLNQLR